LRQVNHALIRDAIATRNIEALEPLAVLCNCIDRLLGDIRIVGNVKGQERGTILNESNEARVGQASTVCQSEALDTCANGQSHDATIVDLLGEGSEVESFDEISVAEEGML
jgi:hypothetical protein